MFLSELSLKYRMKVDNIVFFNNFFKELFNKWVYNMKYLVYWKRLSEWEIIIK